MHLLKSVLALALLASCLPLRADGPTTAPGRNANIILDNPFPDNPSLAPTLVTFDLTDASPSEAHDALASAGKMPQLVRFYAPTNLRVTFSFHETPFLDALMQIRTELKRKGPTDPLNLGADEHRYNITDAPGTWCVSGPFVFALSSVKHHLELNRDGRAERSSLDVDMTINVEPRFQFLTPLDMITLTEARDDKGNSLLNASSDPHVYGYFNHVFFALQYPQDPGRRITSLKGSASLAIAHAGNDLVFDNLDEATQKTSAGLKISVGPIQTSGDYYVIPATCDRGDMTNEKFEALQTALIAATPALHDGKARVYFEWLKTKPKRDGDRLTFEFRFRILKLPDHPTAPDTLLLNLPTDFQELRVPFAFKDLPLP